MTGVLTPEETCPVCDSPASWLHRRAHPMARQVLDASRSSHRRSGHAATGHAATGHAATGHPTAGRSSVGRSWSGPTPPRVRGLRRRRPQDVAACGRLLRVVHAEDGYPARWVEPPRAWLEGDDVLASWVVERQGEILGHVAVSTVGKGEVLSVRWAEMTGEAPAALAGVTRLYVRPRVRRQGIGRALLDAAVADIRARGLVPVADVVAASREAMSLYESQGWQLLAMDPWREQPDELRVWCYRLPR